MSTETTNPLITLYGEEALDVAANKIEDLRKNSNFHFDQEYMNNGIAFLMIKANKIISGESKGQSLESLVSESFGEAAIYKFNCQ